MPILPATVAPANSVLIAPQAPRRCWTKEEYNSSTAGSRDEVAKRTSARTHREQTLNGIPACEVRLTVDAKIRETTFYREIDSHIRATLGGDGRPDKREGVVVMRTTFGGVPGGCGCPCRDYSAERQGVSGRFRSPVH